MKMCQPHWDDLRDEIKLLGLDHLVAKSGEEAAEMMVAELDGTGDKRVFDPLMSAYWAITSNALSSGGLYLLSPDEDGNEYCPLCELDKNFPDEDPVPSKDWIEKSSKEQLQRARALDIVPKLQ